MISIDMTIEPPTIHLVLFTLVRCTSIMHHARCTVLQCTINIHCQPRYFVFRPFAMQRAPWYSGMQLCIVHLSMVHFQQGSEIERYQGPRLIANRRNTKYRG